jgi:hypothetical protein
MLAASNQHRDVLRRLARRVTTICALGSATTAGLEIDARAASSGSKCDDLSAMVRHGIVRIRGGLVGWASGSTTPALGLRAARTDRWRRAPRRQVFG